MSVGVGDEARGLPSALVAFFGERIVPCGGEITRGQENIKLDTQHRIHEALVPHDDAHGSTKSKEFC